MPFNGSKCSYLHIGSRNTCQIYNMRSRVVKNPGFFGIVPVGSVFAKNPGFLPKTPGFVVSFFVVLLYIINIGLQSDFIQAITESNYSLKTTKQL